MKTIGILGGLGPAASCRLFDNIVRLCPADRDQDHPDVILYSKASIPDRTAFMLGRTDEDPLPAMLAGVETLIAAGADMLAMPCVTAHHFHPPLAAASRVPFLNMLELTANTLAEQNVTSVALLATEGTYFSGAFRRALNARGIDVLIPDAEQAYGVMALIYSIKAGHMYGNEIIEGFAAPLIAQGAQRVILGCTELSLFTGLDEMYVDPLMILAQELLLLAADGC